MTFFVYTKYTSCIYKVYLRYIHSTEHAYSEYILHTVCPAQRTDHFYALHDLVPDTWQNFLFQFSKIKNFFRFQVFVALIAHPLRQIRCQFASA